MIKMEQRKDSKLTITVEADTNNLSAKLKAIAKHTSALAEELDTIDGCANLLTDEVKERLDNAIMNINFE